MSPGSEMTAELQAAVAKIAVTAIMPILQMCAQTLRADLGTENDGRDVGYMTGLAFHQHDETNLNPAKVLHGFGQAFGNQARDNSAAAQYVSLAASNFIAGLEQGFGEPVSIFGEAVK